MYVRKKLNCTYLMILVKNQKIKIIKVMCNGKAYYYLPIDVNCKIFVIIKYDKCSRIMIKYLIKILLLT